VFSIFGAPETLHSDQGKEFENKLILELQNIYGYKKTKTTPYRPQGNSILDRIHKTIRGILAMYSNMKQSDWASLLPFVQLAHNTPYNTTVQEIPFYLMFGRRPTLPINIILGEPEAMPISTQEYSKQTVDNLQLAYELARQNIGEMALRNESKATEHTIPTYEVGAKVWLHKPHTSADAPNPKLLSPWRGPYAVI
ncbi:unnamed protein product, partial [Choristocarpus tenellus]